MRTLISMTEYVIDQYEQCQQSQIFEEKCFDYAKFLKQPLKLEMFEQLFEGFSLEDAKLLMKYSRTIEDIVKYKPILTQKTYEKFF